MPCLSSRAYRIVRPQPLEAQILRNLRASLVTMKRARPSHSWEETTHRHTWESDEEGAREKPLDPEEYTVDECVEEFVGLLLSMLTSGCISARLFCELCFWSAGFSGNETLRKYSRKPGNNSGHYARHLDAVLGTNERKAQRYTLAVPGHQRHDLARTMHRIPVVLGHEALADEMASDSSLSVRLAEAKEADLLPPTYFTHPIVVNAGGAPVLPIALYCDAIPYSRTDSAIGFWLVNMVSGAHHLLVVMRKRMGCKCGCRGWCSVDPVFRLLRWSLSCLCEAKYPIARHDGEAWREEDSHRATLAGAPFRMRAALVHIKGDWSEYANTWGFTSWASADRPCLFCTAPKNDMYQVTNLSPVSFPFHENEDCEYWAACDRSEVVVHVTEALHKAIALCLRYDKRKNGSHGRALVRDIEGTPLRAHDRLEPSEVLPDVGQFESLRSFPARLVFWRPSKQTLVLHRNPLWDVRLGITPVRTLTVDALHTFNLGVMQSFCKVAAWKLLDGTQWGEVSASSEERIRVAVQCMRADLQVFYQKHKRACPGEQLTQANDLTVKMLGTRSRPQIKLSGAETYGFLLYVVDALKKFRSNLGGDCSNLVEAGDCLVTIQRLSHKAAGKVPPRIQQALGERKA